MVSYNPTQLAIHDGAQNVTVSWDDKHESHYPWWYLRGFCPCATCQGHGGAYDFVDVPASKLAEVNEVGSYALNFTWDDGHQTGIYPFELLRRLCPCGACRAEQTTRHVWHTLSEAQHACLEG